MRARAIVSAAALSLLTGGALAAMPAGAAPGGGGCSLQGTATFTKGPSTTDHPYTYTFKGDLSNCRDSSGGGPAAGKIGTLLPAKGTGTCGSGTTAGTALVTWADKTATIISYTTQSAGAEVVLQGTVVPKYTVTTKVGKRTKKTTYKSTRYVGNNAIADLAFEASPQECAGKGVTSAGIAGFAGIGSQS